MSEVNILNSAWVEKLNGWYQGIIIGGLFALVFWIYCESSLPSDANCAWLASPGTDFLAFLGAALCMWRGKVHNDFLVAAFGACVTVIHICQFVVAKSLF
ncbi:MAG: hypothetical protein HOE69_03185 [Euryarchaeota archaeon]|jgi:hypothetical protein|nr:hypothetical protein [Euryarchaeota archaeon]